MARVAGRVFGRATTLGVLAQLQVVAGSGGAYMKEHSYVGTDFFDNFWFWRWKDPTHGHVKYVDKEEAMKAGFAKASHDRVYIGPDMDHRTDGRPRRSVKIYSNQIFNSGLVVATLDHMPTGCGTWPAFWMTGGNSKEHWPAWGEFDIVEGVHTSTRVMTSLHTSKGCQQENVLAGRDFIGTWDNTDKKPFANNCYIKASGQWKNQGCSQVGPEGSIGSTFNTLGGGTFAAQWAPRGDGAGSFAVWFWRNGTEPADLLRGAPDPAAWGQPYSFFRLNPDTCPSSHFKNMRLVFDLTFCGDMGVSSYAERCPVEAAQMSCKELVSQHPAAFKEAFWSIRRLDTYQWQADNDGVAARRDGNSDREEDKWATEAPGTCAAYGCGQEFHPRNKCQCNSECLSHGNCCWDAAAVCGVGASTTPRPHAERRPPAPKEEERREGPESSQHKAARAVASDTSVPGKEPPSKSSGDPSCSAHPACSDLANDCCPTKVGMMLKCCSQEKKPDRVMFLKRFLDGGRAIPMMAELSFCSIAVLATAALLGVSLSVRMASRNSRRRLRSSPRHQREFMMHKKDAELRKSGSASALGLLSPTDSDCNE